MAGDEELLSIVVEQHERRTLIRLRGDLDIATAPRLIDVLDRANSEIVVDLAELEFLDASGLSALAQGDANADRHGNRLVVVNASPLAQRMLRLTGLDHLLSASDAF